ncbi:MAG: Glu/Leu/Phe/Val dehydrogenase [Bacilli bacterium]|nr:Glu/Leu/Phe/Val dehydrogenase [Bacilli bacterium]
MNKFDYMAEYGYEQLIYFYDKETGLKGVTCIHDTTLGPALGGTRLWNYATEDEAVEDVLRLARGMTYKNAVAGLNIGGGKTVLIGDADKVKSEAYWRAFGRYVQSLNGRYITAEDVNTSPDDMEYVAMETNYIVGLTKTSGDPSPFTALGVYWGMRASCLEKFGSNDLKGRTVLVQGVGHVGYNLVKLLVNDGAKVYVSDIKQEKLDKVASDFPVTIVPTTDIFAFEYEIFAPCAMGAVVNDQTIPQFKFKIICGAANNVLKEERHGAELEKRGILYAPDYVINAGGVINVYQEILGYDPNEAKRKVEKIYGKVLDVFKIAKENNITPAKAADRLAEERIRVIRNIRGNYIKR